MSPLLRAYLALSRVSGPLWRLAMRRRLARGKEHPDRLGEKFGEGYPPRPDGEVIWFHALGVGESLALVPLIETALAARPGAAAVLTTSTATSVPALAKAGLPEAVHHVLLPVDTVAATRAFLGHWRPGLGVVSEPDLWPRLLIEARRAGVPLALVNARLYRGSFASRRRLGAAMGDLLRLFGRIGAQDAASAEGFARLGADPARIEVTGPLKAAARPLPCDEGELARLRGVIGDRLVWLAAATEASEHADVVAAHTQILATEPQALLIATPRHVKDGSGLAALARDAGLSVAQRSDGEVPGADTQVYVADTIGEMGLWYRLAPVTFVGHSLPGRGLTGKNPFEAAALGAAILTGPDVSDFAESYDALAAKGGARAVEGAEALAEAVLALSEKGAREALTRNATEVIAEERAVLDRTWRLVETACR